jgi:hypothetical protein
VSSSGPVPQATQRYESKQMGDEELLRNSELVLPASMEGNGYKRITD